MQALPDLALQTMAPVYVSAWKGRVISGWDVPGTVVPGLRVHRLSRPAGTQLEQYSAKQGGISVKDGHMHSSFLGMWLCPRLFP